MKYDLTREQIEVFKKKVCTLLVSSKDVPEMYRKLNTLETNGLGGWQLLCPPRWVGERLIAVLLRPEPPHEE